MRGTLLPTWLRVGVQVGGFTDPLGVIALICNKMGEGHFLHWGIQVNFFLNELPVTWAVG